jgi:NADP-dependent 3-hydroxy acid dehydrogenase YdfG
MGALSNQVAVVTGAGSGIGKAIAGALAAQGATVCLVGRTVEKLESTAKMLSGTHAVFPTDLSQDSQIEAFVAELQQRYPQIDVLVMCAGEIAHGLVQDSPVAVLDKLFRANVHGNYLLIQKLLPALRQCRGQVVIINSSAGLSARPNVGQYSATKHALKAITDALRGEVNELGIRVLSVYAGRTATPLMETIYKKDAKDYKPELLLQPEDIASVVLNALTLPRTAEVTDISIRPMRKSY